MRLLQTASKFRLAMLLGAATGLAAGCVVTLGDGSSRSECGGTFSNSSVQSDGTCACDVGYDWCNPSDSDDYECCALEACVTGSNNHVEGADCVCDAGYDWCTSDPDDLNCCEVGGGETGSSSGDGDGDGDSGTTGDGDGDNLPPETCTADEEGATWCSKDEGDDLTGSRWWFCIDGVWEEYPNFLDENCVDEGFDFALGCYYDATGMTNVPVCGEGPGTACDSAEPDACSDTDTLQACLYDRLTETSCQTFCENGSMNGLGQDFLYGLCEVVEGEAGCSCSDDAP